MTSWRHVEISVRQALVQVLQALTNCGGRTTVDELFAEARQVTSTLRQQLLVRGTFDQALQYLINTGHVEVDEHGSVVSKQ
jgi:hypothetical protein